MDKSTTDNSLATATTKEELELLAKFRELILEENEFVCPKDDNYILKFLRGAKLDPEAAFLKLTNWWKDRQRFPQLYDGLYPSRYESIYRSKFLQIFANRDNIGRQIVLWNVGNWNPSEVSFLDLLRANFPTIDTILTRQLTQLHGVVFIFDFNGLGLSHVRALNPTNLRTILKLFDGYPLRIKGVHFVNHPRIFQTVWNVAKTFMKPKLKKRVEFHEQDFKFLHETFSVEILPECYGGKLTEDNFIEPGFIKSILDQDQYYRDFFDNYGYKSHSNKSSTKSG